MRGISASGLSWWHLLLFASICLQIVLGIEPAKSRSNLSWTCSFAKGISGDYKSSTGAKAESHTSSSKTGTKLFLLLVGFGAVAGFSFFLYKLWQKKKRDEQYARLLKLFEEDDELEIELGLRD